MSSKYYLNSSTLSQAKEASQDHTLKPDNLYRTRRGKDVVHPLQRCPWSFPIPNPAVRSDSIGTTWQSCKPDLEVSLTGACCHIYFSDLLLTKEAAGWAPNKQTRGSN